MPCEMPRVKVPVDLLSVVVFSSVWSLSCICYVLCGYKSFEGSRPPSCTALGGTIPSQYERVVSPGLRTWAAKGGALFSQPFAIFKRKIIFPFHTPFLFLCIRHFSLSSSWLPSSMDLLDWFYLVSFADSFSVMLRIWHFSFCLSYLFCRSGVSKLWPGSQIWPAERFCK